MKTYEELRGAKGRRVFYRPERFLAKTLFQGALPATDIGSVSHKLEDISLSGLAVICPHPEQSFNIDTIVTVRLRVDTTTIHEGRAKVARHEAVASGTRIGLTFVDGFLDIPVLLTRYKEQTLQQELNKQLYSDTDLVPESYKILCANLLHTLRQYRRTLDQWPQEHIGSTEAQERDILNLCEGHYLEKWREFQRKAVRQIEAVQSCSKTVAALKTWTETMVTPDLIGGPIWRQAYEKPMGYPGDRQVMEHAYNSKTDRGESLYDRFAHRLGVDACLCVATRMNMMQIMLTTEMQKRGDTNTAITNLGCGTAQEIVNTLQQRDLPGTIKISLIDQDENALTHAYNAAYPDVIRHQGKVSVQGFHSSFIELMKGGALCELLPEQDIVYSLGLFDYLKEKRARILLESLYARTKPGGLVVIGNLKRSDASVLWAAEMVCDWTMIYRSEEDMRALAKNIPCEDLVIEVDATDKIYMMSLRKPLS